MPVARLAPLLLTALLLTGCSGAGSEDASSTDSGGGDQSAPLLPGSADGEGAPADLGDDGADGDGGGTAAGTGGPLSGGDPLARVVPADRSLIRTATLTVRVEDLAVAGRRAGDLVRKAGGDVYGEETSTGGGDGRSGSSSLTLKVPPAGMDALLEDLTRLGTVLDRGLTTEDVTEQVTDVEARLTTQRASVTRVRALLAQAKTVGEVVAVEAELAEREATLESLQARSRALAGQVSLSTVQLYLVGPDADAPDGEERGFLVGLERGWDAFLGTGAVGLTVLGALLPFLVAAVAVAAVVLALRARRRRPVQPAA